MGAGDWGTPVLIEGDGATYTSGSAISLAEVAGSPAIAFSSFNGGAKLDYARANNTTGTPATAWTDAGSSFLTLDTGCQCASLAVINGNPAVAYQRTAADDLYYALASTNSGGALADWALVDADSTGSAGQNPALALVGGMPAIIHGDDTNSQLQLTHATTASGASQSDWPDSTVVDANGSTGYYDSLCDVNGYAAVAYYVDAPDYKLRYAVLYQ
jgi:hypothetical protein